MNSATIRKKHLPYKVRKHFGNGCISLWSVFYGKSGFSTRGPYLDEYEAYCICNTLNAGYKRGWDDFKKALEDEASQ